MAAILQKNCRVCRIELTGRKTKFCSRTCSDKDYRQQNAETLSAKHKEMRQRRNDYINKVKLEKGCVKCGYNSHPAALDFNHIHPEEKLFSIASSYRSLEETAKEIAKCEVLCANCHRIHSLENDHYTTRMDNS